MRTKPALAVALLFTAAAAQASTANFTCQAAINVPFGGGGGSIPCQGFRSVVAPPGGTLTGVTATVFVASDAFNPPNYVVQTSPVLSFPPAVFTSDGSFTASTSDPFSLAQMNVFGAWTMPWGTITDANSSIIGSMSVSAFGTYTFDLPAGSSQASPVLPFVIDLSGPVPVYRLIGQSGQWFDPPGTTGFEYNGMNGTLFTEVGLPLGFDDPFNVLVPDGAGGFAVVTTQGGGTLFTFASPVSQFRITGINPTVDSDSGAAFPTQLFFVDPAGEFTMTALADVPEPGTWAMMLGGAAVCWFRRRRNLDVA